LAENNNFDRDQFTCFDGAAAAAAAAAAKMEMRGKGDNVTCVQFVLQRNWAWNCAMHQR
jgi:hypothetical protein